MIPSTLSGWTLDVIRGLLIQGYHESEEFDFKRELPHPKNESDKDDLRTDCAAFANSDGGFLIFGVADPRTGKTGEARLEGLSESVELPVLFGPFPAECVPSIHWTPLNPALRLDSGRKIHVIHIPRSWKAPHAVKKSKGFLYPKRTNQGNAYMDYSEVRSMFLGYYEKRIRLQLLEVELSTLHEEAKRIAGRRDEPTIGMVDQSTLDLSVVESVLADTYTITSAHQSFISSMNRVRLLTRSINNADRNFWDVQLVSKNTGMSTHTRTVFVDRTRNWAQDLIRACEQSLSDLKEILKG